MDYFVALAPKYFAPDMELPTGRAIQTERKNAVGDFSYCFPLKNENCTGRYINSRCRIRLQNFYRVLRVIALAIFCQSYPCHFSGSRERIQSSAGTYKAQSALSPCLSIRFQGPGLPHNLLRLR